MSARPHAINIGYRPINFVGKEDQRNSGSGSVSRREQAKLPKTPGFFGKWLDRLTIALVFPKGSKT
jgi:hypothetical protein